MNICNSTSADEPVATPVKFIKDIFEAKAFQDGRSLKRSKKSVQRFVSETALVREANNRSYDVYDLGDEYLLIKSSRTSIVKIR